ncbi:MAG: hypothetical protein P1U74_11335 [Legionellaceae bacterium]|nr:hypothetical protein [Legionellaceae bacterium]
MDRYFVFPVFSRNYQSPVIWVGVHYHGKKDIDSSKSSLEGRKAEFITETNKKIDKLNIGKFNYLELLADNDINNGLCVAQENSKLSTICQRQVLLAHYEPIKNQIIEELGDFITALVISSLIWFLIILLPLLREIDD